MGFFTRLLLGICGFSGIGLLISNADSLRSSFYGLRELFLLGFFASLALLIIGWIIFEIDFFE